MIRVAGLVLVGLIPACQSDETVAGFGAADTIWQLTELAGDPVTVRATLQFPEAGQIAGQAPCNRYSAKLTAPYPRFETGPILSTRMACPDLAQETAFFDALADMSQAELLDDTLILQNDAGRDMVFKATE
jgi:heat shock protein HslJ